MKIKSLILSIAASTAFLATNIQQSYAAQTQNYGQPNYLDYMAQAKGYSSVNNFGAAWTACNEAIKLNPNEWICYFFRGDCSGKMGNNNAAIIDYKIALGFPKNNVDNGALHFSIATSYALMNDFQNAEFHILTAARLGDIQAQNLCIQYNVPY